MYNTYKKQKQLNNIQNYNSLFKVKNQNSDLQHRQKSQNEVLEKALTSINTKKLFFKINFFLLYKSIKSLDYTL